MRRSTAPRVLFTPGWKSGPWHATRWEPGRDPDDRTVGIDGCRHVAHRQRVTYDGREQRQDGRPASVAIRLNDERPRIVEECPGKHGRGLIDLVDSQRPDLDGHERARQVRPANRSVSGIPLSMRDSRRM